MPKYEELVEIPVGNETVIGASTMAFPCLSFLWIEDCPLLSSMPLYPSLDNELRLVNTSSRPLKQTIQMNITISTSSLPLSKFEAFNVWNIEELNSNLLQDCLQNMTFIKELTITDCRELDLEDMALQWYLLKNLNYLKINNLPQLVSLPLWLQHLVQLKELKIENCSGLRSLLSWIPTSHFP
ncbi:hypothetical protein HRI_001636700 [Hibiscus trionum]|uniref:Uncharacterized protein n=1 Tax=Hibiscus trionum TaxID=183268 RepID=A0A9W7HLM6_HIBTR|nr:hypothetical protein HRI_001636700 [Hibiscus trionum]